MDNFDGDIDILGHSDESKSPRPSDLSPQFPEKNVQWSLEENQLFEIGFSQFGNKWSKVAQLIGSKTATQVRNYAKKLQKTKPIDGAVEHYTIEDGVNLYASSTSEVTRIEHFEENLDEIDVGSDSAGSSSSCKIGIEGSGAAIDVQALTITNEERQIHHDFFSGSLKKTPDRYLKIRSHILKEWEKCHPQYLTKGAARTGLNNCGDINSIGKIHSYLESIGAINVNCDLGNRHKKVNKEKPAIVNPIPASKVMSLRKRKSQDDYLEEIDMKDKGLTIEHGEDGSEINRLIIQKTPKLSKPKNNPFQLVPCVKYSVLKPAPFELITDLRVFFVAETHSYLFQSEVIGLLGGQFYPDKRQLKIQCAVPCNSLSSDVECEMDPVSQSEACEYLRSSGLKVVGWYHSHPTFDPNPSYRDLETQCKYQDMFLSQTQQPFVSLIISPFLKGAPTSKFCWWFIENDTVSNATANLEPYELSVRYEPTGTVDHIKEVIAKMVQSEKDSRQRIKKVDVPKLINSLKLHGFRAGLEEVKIESALKIIRDVL